MLRRLPCNNENTEKLNVRDIGASIPSLSGFCYVEQIFAKVSELDYVTKELQRDDMNLADAEFLFDTV